MFVVFFFLVVAGVFLFTHSHRKGVNAAWSRVADATGLTLVGGSTFQYPQIEGERHGVHVRVQTTSSGGKNSSTLTVYRTAHTSDAPQVRFSRQGGFSFLRAWAGRNDVIVGDPRFDDSIVVDSPDPDAIRTFLTPARRAAILTVFSTWRTAEVTNGWITAKTNGVERDASVMIGTINRLVDVSRLFADHESVDHALAQRDAGELAVAASELHALNTVDTPNVVAQVMEAETLVSLGRSEEATEVLDLVDVTLPADAEASGWRAAAAARPVPQGEGPPLDAQLVLDALFGSRWIGHEIEAAFVRDYQGRVIRWSGEVESARSYRRDADFGEGPGTKAVVRIGAIGSSNLFSNRVKAMVDLPDGITISRGDHIEFRGTLHRIDRFIRAFYVASATLIAAENEESQAE